MTATHQREAKGQGTAPAISPFADGGLHSSKQLKLLSWFLETGALFGQGPSNQERGGPKRLARYSGSGRAPRQRSGVVHNSHKEIAQNNNA